MTVLLIHNFDHLKKKNLPNVTITCAEIIQHIAGIVPICYYNLMNVFTYISLPSVLLFTALASVS
jgi:hypothetical protein